MQPEPVSLALSSITVDRDLQARSHIDPWVVETYADVLVEGGALPPVQAVSDGGSVWLVDGFHRLAAHEEAGLSAIAVEVTPGDYTKAVRLAVRANATNGHHRGQTDLNRALQIAMRHGLIGDPPAVEDVMAVLACSQRSAYRLLEPWRRAQERALEDRIRVLHAEGATQRAIAAATGAGRERVRRVVRGEERAKQWRAGRDAEKAVYAEVAAAADMSPMIAQVTDLQVGRLLDWRIGTAPEKAAAAVPERDREQRLEQARALADWLTAFVHCLESRPSRTRH